MAMRSSSTDAMKYVPITCASSSTSDEDVTRSVSEGGGGSPPLDDAADAVLATTTAPAAGDGSGTAADVADVADDHATKRCENEMRKPRVDVNTSSPTNASEMGCTHSAGSATWKYRSASSMPPVTGSRVGSRRSTRLATHMTMR